MLSITRSLQSCALLLIDVLVRATTDEYSSQVASESRQALMRFSENRLRKDCRPIVEVLEENVFSLASRLPTCLSSSGFTMVSCTVLTQDTVLCVSYVCVSVD
jgi:hypothetical protein